MSDYKVYKVGDRVVFNHASKGWNVYGTVTAINGWFITVLWDGDSTTSQIHKGTERMKVTTVEARK
jgi:hypothetical protein